MKIFLTILILITFLCGFSSDTPGTREIAIIEIIWEFILLGMVFYLER